MAAAAPLPLMRLCWRWRWRELFFGLLDHRAAARRALLGFDLSHSDRLCRRLEDRPGIAATALFTGVLAAVRSSGGTCSASSLCRTRPRLGERRLVESPGRLRRPAQAPVPCLQWHRPPSQPAPQELERPLPPPRWPRCSSCRIVHPGDSPPHNWGSASPCPGWQGWPGTSGKQLEWVGLHIRIACRSLRAKVSRLITQTGNAANSGESRHEAV